MEECGGGALLLVLLVCCWFGGGLYYGLTIFITIMILAMIGSVMNSI
jgi:hypothetical protein